MVDRTAKGTAIRRAVLGDAYVDCADAAKTAFDQPSQNPISEGARGTLWSDDTIPLRERSMLTLALLAVTGNFTKSPCTFALPPTPKPAPMM